MPPSLVAFVGGGTSLDSRSRAWQVIVHGAGSVALVHEVLSDGSTGVRGEELERGGFIGTAQDRRCLRWVTLLCDARITGVFIADP